MKKLLSLSLLGLLILTSCNKVNTNVKKITTYSNDDKIKETLKYVYNSDGLLTQTYIDDATFGKTRSSTFYNDKKQVEKEVYEYEVDGEYVGAYYTYFVYDEKGNNVLSASYDYDFDLDFFELVSLEENKYNNKNL